MPILEQDSWTTDVDFIISDIYEYDMRRGGLSIIKEKQLLSEDEIKKLESMDKFESNKAIGVMEITNKELKKEHNAGFREYRLLFGEMNDLTDDNIISVKKDAIFCTKYCSETKIGKYIEFREKNQYHAFLRLPGKPGKELYWNSYTGDIDVKGIKDELVLLHKDYLLKSISTVIRKLSSYDIAGAKTTLVKLMNDYKFRRLPAGYYREFNVDSKFRQVIADRELLIDAEDMSDYYIQTLRIEYNYLNVLVPLFDLVVS